ncbi:DUF550 domain-containing protein [Salmonella enterica]|nr:DUF550 domain-containing protein [Salmonella enterica]ECJ0800064.1 DUF550 domain-containing protein [Salmonella enterica]
MTITKERLLKIQQWSETYGAGSNVMLPAEEAEELARIALASLEAEPVSQPYKLPEEKGASLQLRNLIRKRHAEWSDKTFGNVGPVGPLKHLSKEALEAAADPSDPLEWADMQFLLWDAQRRMGLSDEFITRAMIEKLEINKSRQWPEPKDGEPRLHIKEQPAPIVPPAIEPDYKVIKSILPTANPDEYACCIAADMWNACRAVMLQSKYRDLSQPVDPQISEYEKIMLRAGWVMVPVEPTDEMIAAAMNCEDVLFNSDESFCVQFGNIYEAMLAAAPQHEVK